MCWNLWQCSESLSNLFMLPLIPLSSCWETFMRTICCSEKLFFLSHEKWNSRKKISSGKFIFISSTLIQSALRASWDQLREKEASVDCEGGRLKDVVKLNCWYILTVAVYELALQEKNRLFWHLWRKLVACIERFITTTWISSLLPSKNRR